MWLRADCRDMELAVFHFFSLPAPSPPSTQKLPVLSKDNQDDLKTRIPEMPVSERLLSES